MLGLAFGLGYPGRFWLLAIASVPLIGVLEVLQTWMPGRHARFGDFVVDALAALVGLAAAAVLARAVGRPPQRT